ncbi:hypothetical protein ACJJTC_015740 [Scirpophaga incertulas]
MTLKDYNKLKQEAILTFGRCHRHSQLLSSLKEIFRNDINSPRRYEQLTTIGELLKILEIRDVLSENNVEPLKQIAIHIPNNKELLQNINEYELTHTPVEYINFNESTPNAVQNKIVECVGHNDTNEVIDKRKQRIIEEVTENIGTFWRDLARSLGIKERDIEEINKNQKLTDSKATDVMNLYLKKADKQTWFLDLCEALESSRRKDLANKLKKISVMNI